MKIDMRRHDAHIQSAIVEGAARVFAASLQATGTVYSTDARREQAIKDVDCYIDKIVEIVG